MFSSLLVAFVVGARTVAAQDFWWSYQAENTTDSYDPVFEICGSNCSDCAAGARQCFSQEFTNICYEPKLGETCCKDRYGTSCYDDFYCAYTEDDVAFCCAEDEDVEDCGKNFNETLTSSKRPEPSVTSSATNVFAPSMTATDQTVAARPDRTHVPSVPGKVDSKGYIEDPDADQDVSTAVKIGIAIGAFIGAAVLITLAVLFFLHRRKKSKYNQLGGNAGDKLLAQHPEPYPAQPMPTPISSAPSAFEPMRNEPPHDPRASWVVSPPVSRQPSPSPFSDAHQTAYSDHPSVHSPPPQIELTHIPPPGMHEAPTAYK